VTVLLLLQGGLLSLQEHAVVVLNLSGKVDPLNVTVHTSRLRLKALRSLTFGREDFRPINDSLCNLPEVPRLRLSDLTLDLNLVFEKGPHLVLNLLLELLTSHFSFLERLEPVELAISLKLLGFHHACKLALKHLAIRLAVPLRRDTEARRGLVSNGTELGLSALSSFGFDA